VSLLRPEIERMKGYTPGFQPVSEDFIKLNTNENPEPPSPRVLAAVQSAAAGTLRFYPDPLATALRRRAGELYGFPPEQVIVGNGSDDLLTMIVRATVSAGDTIAAPYPSYTLYETLAEIQGARMEWVPFPDDFSVPRELAGVGARLTFLANPNSPTGTFAPPDDVARLADAVAGVLVVDEAYVDFASGNSLALARTRPNCLVFRSMSKSYALAGVRVGLGFGPRPLIEGMLKVKDSYNVNRLSQAAGLAALDDQADFHARTERVCAERERVAAALRNLGLTVLPSQANFVFVRLRQPAADVQARLRERKVLVRHFSRPRVSDGLRISIGTREQNDVLLAALREILGA
jgi:histidinol-phosphate aminotransferase